MVTPLQWAIYEPELSYTYYKPDIYLKTVSSYSRLKPGHHFLKNKS